MARIYAGGYHGIVECFDTAIGAWADMTIPGQGSGSIKPVVSLKALAEDNVWVGLAIGWPDAVDSPRIAHWDGYAWDVLEITELADNWYSCYVLPFSATEVYVLVHRWGMSNPDLAWLYKWNGSTFTRLVDYNQWPDNDAFPACIDGVDGLHVYFAGWAASGTKPAIWLWDGSAIVREDAGKGLPGGSTAIYLMLAVLANDKVIVCCSIGYDGDFYVGSFGTWSLDCDVSAVFGSTLYPAYTGYNNKGFSDQPGGKALCWLQNYGAGGFWFWRRSAKGDWSWDDMIPEIDGPLGVGGCGDLLVACGGSAGTGKSDVAYSATNGPPWTGFDRPSDHRFVVDVDASLAPGVRPPWALGAHGEYCLEVTDAKDNRLLGSGHVNRDYTAASRCRFRLLCHRGEWWADPEIGSRLHLIKTLKDARAKVNAFAQEALDPLIREGTISGVETLEVQTDPDSGTLLAHIAVVLPDGQSLALDAIPVGAC